MNHLQKKYMEVLQEELKMDSRECIWTLETLKAFTMLVVDDEDANFAFLVLAIANICDN